MKANGENKHQPKYRKKSVYSTQVTLTDYPLFFNKIFRL